MSAGEQTYFILNYGCQMNASDAERYAGQLEAMGYRAAADFHSADVIIVNTCCVRESAEKRIAGKIGELKAVKAKNPDVVICIAGCMAQKDGGRLLKKYPQLDLLLGTAYVNDLQQILTDYLAARKGRAYTDLSIHPREFEGRAVRQSSFAAWIPVMYGCNNFCTYCIVPYVRGRERSRSMEQVAAEISQAVRQGYKEFTLLGQNVNSYGKDLYGKEAFAALLRRVNAIPGVERIRYMTSHPRDMSEEVIKTVAECEHVCENFHLPVQTGSNAVLRRMNRGYTREQYLELVGLVRQYLPAAAITTDIIVGFPGESDADFAATLSLVRQAAFDAAFTFIYSVRSGTPAASMPQQVPLAEKKARLQQLMAVQNQSSLRHNQALVGQTVEVLAEGPSRDSAVWSGRTRTDKLVLWPLAGRQYTAGERVRVRIEQAQTWLVKGKAVVDGE